jgi:hypothetical protein
MPMLCLAISRLESLKVGSIIADGVEQTLLDFSGLGRISGNVDLSELQLGDSVTLRLYIKVTTGGSWRKYHEETYTDIQILPLIYIVPKETDFGLKVTIQQIAGIFRTFEYNFIKEV